MAILVNWLKKKEKVSLKELIDPSLITFIHSDSRESCIKKLVDLAEKKDKIKDSFSFYEALMEREKIVSTGIGMSVAIPHAKMEEIKDFFIIIGVQKKGGIEWDSLDDVPVRIVFLVGGPENKQMTYLHILSLLTTVIKNKEFRKKILLSEKPEEIFDLFSNLA